MHRSIEGACAAAQPHLGAGEQVVAAVRVAPYIPTSTAWLFLLGLLPGLILTNSLRNSRRAAAAASGLPLAPTSVLALTQYRLLIFRRRGGRVEELLGWVPLVRIESMDVKRNTLGFRFYDAPEVRLRTPGADDRDQLVRWARTFRGTLGPPPPPGPTWVPVPKERSPRWAFVAVAVIGFFLVATMLLGALQPVKPATTSTPLAAPLPTVVPAMDMSQLVIHEAGLGYELLGPEVEGTGARSLDQVAGLNKNPEKSRQLLMVSGLRSGYVRAWAAHRGEDLPYVAEIDLLQFSTREGAVKYYDAAVRATANDPGSEAFALPGLHAIGYRRTFHDPGGDWSELQVLAVRGNHFFVLDLTDADNKDGLMALARAQWTALPS